MSGIPKNTHHHLTTKTTGDKPKMCQMPITVQIHDEINTKHTKAKRTQKTFQSNPQLPSDFLPTLNLSQLEV